MQMRNKREYLARLSGRLGILGLLERLAAARPGLFVFTYHRIAEPGADPFYDPVISATPESFRAQVESLARRTRVLTLAEAMERIASGPPWREPAALITFDDGYRDNFEVAAPILRDHGLPATFFLPTAFLEEPRLSWWDQVACVIKQTRVRRLELPRNANGGADNSSGPPPLTIDLDARPRSEAIRTIIAAFLDETIRDGPWFLERLAERAEVALNDEAMARALFTDWDQVRRWTAPDTGLSVGSHGHSHHKLAGLDGDSQRRELVESKRILEDRLGREVAVLAYPYGWPGTYTDETKALAVQAGYRAAFSGLEGINRSGAIDPFEIRRLNVGSGDSPVLLRARAALHATIGRSLL
jgi:peptidoglycan/xylan/chitin deacetylase (PgdA/CDA1 family)